MNDEKLQHLLQVVIDHYIGKGDPVWSKFLNSLESVDYAPSTIRKYLNVLEKEWLLYQPYDSSGRVPTVAGMSSYMDALIDKNETHEVDDVKFDVDYARNDLRSVVETLWEYVDGAAVWFLKEDEYFYLGINNLLTETLIDDRETTRYLIKFIESKEIVQTLDTKLMKKWEVYYTLLEQEDQKSKLISIVYTKMEVNGYDAVLSVIWPSRVDHKRNIQILKKMLAKHA